MRIDIVFPTLPPMLDGIGDHTALLAGALSEHARVRVLTAQSSFDAIPGASIDRAFTLPPRRGFCEVLHAVRTDPPDWLLLQYNQFSYGRWGLNPYVPWTLYKIRTELPTTRIAILFHEDFVPANNWKHAIATIWQRAQFWSLGRLADHTFFSIQPWVEKYRSWFPSTPTSHLPVGSNIPKSNLSSQAARRRVGIDDDAFVIGIFGTARRARLLPWIRAAAREICRRDQQASILYIGPDGDEITSIMQGLLLHDAGRLPAEDVAVHLRCMDLHLAPFIDGLSTRRGSVMAGLQHGIPTLSTVGPLTDPLLSEQNGRAILCSPIDDPAAFTEAALDLHERDSFRSKLGKAGAELYETYFDWPVLAQRLEHTLREHEHSPAGKIPS